MTRPRLSLDAYVEGVRAGDRAVLARAITLVESDRQEDEELAAALLDAVVSTTGRAVRVGVTGVPGVGKSTLLDAIGMHLLGRARSPVAVLAVDPSSPRSGGSILGDKTRMERLSAQPEAFIRPSPARGHLGGVGRRTRETILLCEAAGFETVLVETVGVGQSETAVRSMVDTFVLLLLPGGGDQLQGIKRGIVEMVDVLAINKADGDLLARATEAQAEYRSALRLFPRPADRWDVPVVTCSAVTGAGVADLWDVIAAHRAHLEAGGHLARVRRDQAVAWLRTLLGDGLDALFRADPRVAEALPAQEAAVADGRTTPLAAARGLLARFAPLPGTHRVL